jgi:hypothetical protein
MYVRIANNVWKVSANDFKKFGGDSYALRIRAKSAVIVFVSYGDAWFRSSHHPRFDSSTEVTKAEQNIINKAFVLPA